MLIAPTQYQIDNKAKMKVDLFHMRADYNKAFRGTLQFPGTLDFRPGVSFFCYTAEEGSEIMHVGFMKPNRRSNFPKEQEFNHRSVTNGNLSVYMIAKEDSKGDTFYVGEALGDMDISTSAGLFFRLFEKDDGTAQLLISQIDFSRRNRPAENNNNIEIVDSRVSNFQ